jgi:hypothetical protein
MDLFLTVWDWYIWLFVVLVFVPIITHPLATICAIWMVFCGAWIATSGGRA